LQLIKGKPVKSFIESQWNNLAWINQTLAEEIGWDDPIGKELEVSIYDAESGKGKVTVAGVIRDFHFKSLHNTIDPLIYLPTQGEHHLFARIAPGRLGDFKKSWQRNLPDREFGYLLSEGFENQYKAEETLLLLLMFFTLLTVALAGLGLYGLTAYIVQTRTKEVGIRKVMGAQVSSIISLLSKDFVRLVLIGAISGCVIAYLLSNDWLTKFAYKADVAWWQWAIPMVVITTLSALLVAFRTYRIAQANPTESLRYE
jgi:putative ABC transport system permease protein